MIVTKTVAGVETFEVILWHHDTVTSQQPRNTTNSAPPAEVLLLYICGFLVCSVIIMLLCAYPIIQSSVAHLPACLVLRLNSAQRCYLLLNAGVDLAAATPSSHMLPRYRAQCCFVVFPTRIIPRWLASSCLQGILNGVADEANGSCLCQRWCRCRLCDNSASQLQEQR